MKRVMLGMVALCGLSATTQARTVSSFNQNWLFERYGLQADGSRKAEPGAKEMLYAPTASSEEKNKGNIAVNAFDGKSGTRWCAANGNGGQWLSVDLLQPTFVKTVQLVWENDKPGYLADVMLSDDGKNWTKASEAKDREPLNLNKPVRFVKFMIKKTPPAAWASIREIILTDKSGKVIKNEKPLAQGVTTPESTKFDDSEWRKLNLPHDWAIEGPFRYDLEGNSGKLPWRGIGWYRKHFTVAADDAGKKIYIDFDGAMANAEVWCNGRYVGGWPYGYQSFRLDLTPFLKFGAENVLAVRLDTENWGSRWYPGAGIYRNVWLVKTAPVHVAQWGTFITTPHVADDSGVARVEVTVENSGTGSVSATVRNTIFKKTADNNLVKIAEATPERINIAPGRQQKSAREITVSKPEKWDIDNPALYLCRTEIVVDGKTVDTYETPFGCRTFEFTARDGFYLNGRRVQIQGVCNHHDLGALGSAVNKSAIRRQLKILREMGCNAIRTSHNPPAPELLELCDQMGFIVMCEAFDCWIHGKKAHDYSEIYPEWHKKDLEAMVTHFRNHPSIIIWSTGNEVAEQGSLNPSKELHDIVKAVDTTRPVSCGVWAGAARSDFRQGVDVFGLNYCIREYPKLLKYPGNEKLPFFSSESSSCISSRGEYFFGMKRSDFQITSYDTDCPGWGCIPDAEFKALDENPAFAGEFVWTGFDYLGEPTPYNNDMSNLLNIHDKDPVKIARMKKELKELGKIRTPSRSSYFGIIDLAGFRKDRFYLYQARWRPELPMVHILPHWNWPDRVGKVTPVQVYTSGDEVELFLNGKSLGRKKKGKFEYRLRWDDVVYQPGELKAVAYKDGRKWAETVMKTTGKPAGLQLSADRATIKSDGADLAYITVRVVDKDGLTVPRSKNHIKFSIVGPGEIVAVDNGDATSFAPFQASERDAYNGLALVIVRSKKGASGKISIKADSDGLKSGLVSVTAK